MFSRSANAARKRSRASSPHAANKSKTKDAQQEPEEEKKEEEEIEDGNAKEPARSSLHREAGGAEAAVAMANAPAPNRNDDDADDDSGDFVIEDASIHEKSPKSTTSNNDDAAGIAEATNETAAAPTTTSTTPDNDNPPPAVPLYKSTRFKGYLTILLGSIIYYDAAQKSRNAFAAATVPATARQEAFCLGVSIVSMSLSGGALGAHLDSVSPLQHVWKRAFAPKSRIELCVALLLFVWWVAAVGWQTSIQGLAGDGKGQYSLYYSSWVCLYSAFFGVLEPWWVAAGWSSLRAFVQSWPFRSPGWLCLFSFGLLDLVWILDLWRNYPALRDREASLFLYYYIEAVPTGQWQFVITLSVFTIVASAAWVVVEIFRGTTPEGLLARKQRWEVIAEGLSILVLLVLWIPSIMLVTTSGGLAHLVGNAYFFSWLVVIFLAETAVWFVHDLREMMHQSLQDKERAYREHQRAVLAKQQAFQRQQHHDQRNESSHNHDGDNAGNDDDDNDGQSSIAAPEFFDALSEF